MHECYRAVMAQLTLRVPDELVAQLKAAAAARSQSVNSLATAVLGAAVDPDLAGDEYERLRERLAQAGLLFHAEAAKGRDRPSRAALRSARAAAGRGRPLADLVDEGRG